MEISPFYISSANGLTNATIDRHAYHIERLINHFKEEYYMRLTKLKE